MSGFTDDMRAIEKWGQDVAKAAAKGLPRPSLVLPSHRNDLDRQADQTPPVCSDSSPESLV